MVHAVVALLAVLGLVALDLGSTPEPAPGPAREPAQVVAASGHDH